MKTIGFTDKKWSLQEAINQQVEKEAWLEWALKEEGIRAFDNVPSQFEVTEEIKQAFASSFHFIKNLPKL